MLMAQTLLTVVVCALTFGVVGMTLITSATWPRLTGPERRPAGLFLAILWGTLIAALATVFTT